MTIETLAAVIVFAAAFILGGKFHRPGNIGRRSFLSFSAGAAVAYIFVHLRPELEMARNVFMAERTGPFSSHAINVATMIGFVVFYGLEKFVADSRKIAGELEIEEEHPSHMFFRINVGVFAVYAFLVGFLLVNNLEGTTVPLFFYTVAMGLHFLTVGHSLHKEYGPLYDRMGARILAGSTFAGWGIAMVMDFSKPIVALLLGFIAGGVMVNTIIAELPTEKEGRFFPFLMGAISYTVILLLSV
jgi:hypothetical protein